MLPLLPVVAYSEPCNSFYTSGIVVSAGQTSQVGSQAAHLARQA